MTAPAPGYLKRTAATAVLNSAISAVAVVFLLPLVIRWVGLSSYGVWSILNLFVALASLLDFGISKALIYEIRRNQFSPPELLGTALGIATLATLAVALAMAAALAGGLRLFGPAVTQVAGLSALLPACGAVVLFSQLATTLCRSVLEAHFKSDLVNVGYIGLTLAYYGTAALIARLAAGPKPMVVGSTCVYVAVLVVHFLLVLLIVPRAVGAPSRRAARSLLHYGSRVFLLELPTMALVPALQFALQRTASDGRQYGIFELAFRISNLASSTLASISSPFFAMVAGAAPGEAVAMRRRVGRQIRLCLSLAAAGWLSFLLVGRFALGLVFGLHDEELFKVALLLLAGQALLGSVEPITRMLMGLGRLKGLLFARIAMLCGTVAMALCGWPAATLERFAIALASGYILAALITAELNRRERWGRAH